MADESKRIVVESLRLSSPDFMGENQSKTMQFLQGMMDRLGVSFHKYGPIRRNFPHLRTGVDNVRLRLEQYEKTGNTEFLIDASNYCLIEFMRPSIEGAHFRSTDSDESPGVQLKSGEVFKKGERAE